jgi:NADPH:quinone reductase-like Zn-dependent oxidoreductase
MKKLVAVAPDKVEVIDVEMPVIQDDEVLVRGVRSLLSPGSELKRVRTWKNAYRDRTWPNHDLGYAMTGVVEQVGASVETVKPGDHVMTSGKHQQYVVVNGSMQSRRPAVPLPRRHGLGHCPVRAVEPVMHELDAQGQHSPQ